MPLHCYDRTLILASFLVLTMSNVPCLCVTRTKAESNDAKELKVLYNDLDSTDGCSARWIPDVQRFALVE